MVILKSTAVPGLSLNLGVEVKKVLLVYFERHARRVPIEFPRTPNNSILSTAYKKRAGPDQLGLFFGFLFFSVKKKGTKVASSNARRSSGASTGIRGDREKRRAKRETRARGIARSPS